MLEVIAPGLHSTVQDGGRPDAAPLGVPRSGACDPLALAAANALLGNDPDAPGLEMTWIGSELAVRQSTVVSLAGADLGGRVDDGRMLRPGTALLIGAGATLRLRQARDGARAYLALPGGLDVPHALGSASTAPVGGFGGIDGRPIRAGDVLRATTPDALDGGGRTWPGPGPSSGVAPTLGPRFLRLVDGPHHGDLGAAARARLLSTEWTVDPRSDRSGVRLAGPPLPTPNGPAPLSLGMVWGAMEVPAGGLPILLLVDGPTVGGYRVPAVVASVDRPVLGQLRPGDVVRFEWIGLDEAHALHRAADAELAEAIARVRMARAIS